MSINQVLFGISRDAKDLLMAIDRIREKMPFALEQSNMTEVQAGIMWAVGTGWSHKRYEKARDQLAEKRYIERVEK